MFFFQAQDGIRDSSVTGVQTGAFPFSSRRRHTRFKCDWSSDVCSSDLGRQGHERGQNLEQLPPPCCADSCAVSPRHFKFDFPLLLIANDEGAPIRLEEQSNEIGRASCRERV